MNCASNLCTCHVNLSCKYIYVVMYMNNQLMDFYRVHDLITRLIMIVLFLKIVTHNVANRSKIQEMALG